jgi:hypothetical protein
MHVRHLALPPQFGAAMLQFRASDSSPPRISGFSEKGPGMGSTQIRSRRWAPYPAAAAKSPPPRPPLSDRTVLAEAVSHGWQERTSDVGVSLALLPALMQV